MDSNQLYILRYRKGLPGVQTSFILASSIEMAEEVGKAYCSNHMNSRFITVEKAVVADESILGLDVKNRVVAALKQRIDNDAKAAAGEEREGAAGAAPKQMHTGGQVDVNKGPATMPKSKAS